MFACIYFVMCMYLFHRIRTLGIGSFGRVYLVQHKTSGKEYALKVVNKNLASQQGQEKALFRERDIMTRIDHPFSVHLLATAQDARNVYIIQQLVPFGDLWTLLYASERLPATRLGGISSEHASFYAANILSVISHLHDKDVVWCIHSNFSL